MEGGKGQKSWRKEKEAIKVWRTRGGLGKGRGRRRYGKGSG